MEKDSLDYVNSQLRKLTKLNYIKPGDVPDIDLYMDQVTTFMDSHLSDVKRYEDDKILTKTMINNYAKNNLLPPPVKKKYSKDHIYILAFIYYFKSLLSISDIQALLSPLTSEFFGDESTPSLDDIYKEIYTAEKKQLANISKDVIQQYRLSKDAFGNVDEGEDKKFLQLFSFVSLLSFDVYIKKNIIENIIDDLIDSENKERAPKGKAAKNKKTE